MAFLAKLTTWNLIHLVYSLQSTINNNNYQQKRASDCCHTFKLVPIIKLSKVVMLKTYVQQKYVLMLYFMFDKGYTGRNDMKWVIKNCVFNSEPLLSKLTVKQRLYNTIHTSFFYPLPPFCNNLCPSALPSHIFVRNLTEKLSKVLT